jgi:hypothetical protein
VLNNDLDHVEELLIAQADCRILNLALKTMNWLPRKSVIVPTGHFGR